MSTKNVTHRQIYTKCSKHVEQIKQNIHTSMLYS